MKQKLYTSKKWLEQEIYRKHKTPVQIAKEQGVAIQTIYNNLAKNGIRF